MASGSSLIGADIAATEGQGLGLAVSDSFQQALYTPIRVLGRGAFGEAVLYRKTEDNCLVVWKEVNLKRCPLKERHGAQNEIDILSMLNHANIITYYNHFLDEDTLFIEMEYANGGTLYEKINKQNGQLLAEELVIWYFFQLSSALCHLHEYAILHRDIKTLNIFLTKSGLIKLGDFGISKLLDTENEMAESVVGTPYYMSPELCKGQQYNAKSDIWAMGCVLYELLTLKKTFDASNALKLVWGIVKNDVNIEEISSEYTDTMKTLVSKLLEKEPEKRPSAEEILDFPILKTLGKEMEAKVWELNKSARKARLESSSSNEATPIVTSKTSEVYYWGGGRLTPHKLDLFKAGNSAVQVACGHNHFAVVTVENELYTWMNTQGGQASVALLGHGDKAAYKAPKKVDAFHGMAVVSVSCGEEFTACVTDDGDVYTFGLDYYGCIGCDIQYGDEVSYPVLVDFFRGNPVQQISCGDSHVVALTKKGEVYSWGCGEFGRLGLGDEEDYASPQKVPIRGGRLIKAICAGSDGTFFLTVNGRLLACGSNEHNKLGFNTVTAGLRKRQVKECYDIPCQYFASIVKPLTRYHVERVSAGQTHSAVIDEFGRLITFGSNRYGQLGVGDFKKRSTICEITRRLGGKMVEKVSCGNEFTVVSTSDNHIYSFGNANSGRLGVNIDGTSTQRNNSIPSPRPIFGTLKVVPDMFCQHWHTIMIVEKVLNSKTLRTHRSISHESLASKSELYFFQYFIDASDF
ncbi:serine/threonine-protein kinase Nek9-like isoform X2 [Anneissia japonica]|uniref:serine/threonine-protein kinase Nek9-like isoform X2 n=1 Tax=Anneissia japonica TaxID=1529436 RepID=UPI001425A2F7|nr:serine/threonine-protein kinase Nek9-like isoform X2 [Anneissia japonica]